MRIYSVIFFIIIFGLTYGSLKSQSITLSLDTLRFPAFIWPSEPPADCPFPQSKEFHAIKFVGIKSGYHYGDTWFPTWASNDTMYSPWTDGETKRIDGKYSVKIYGQRWKDFLVTVFGKLLGKYEWAIYKS